MTEEQIEKIVTEAFYGSDSHHWSAEAQVRKALAVARKHSTARIAELEAENARLRAIVNNLATLTDLECDFIDGVAGFADGFALRDAARAAMKGDA
jgi:hypothetical protein